MVLPLGVILLYINTPQFLSSKQHLYFALYIIIVSLYSLGIGAHYSVVDIVMEYCKVAFSASLIMLLCNSNNSVLNKRILLTFGIIILIASVGTFIAERFMPGAVRLTAPGEIDNHTLIQSLKRMGMSNYGLPHAIPVLIPAFIAGLKSGLLSVKQRIILLIVFFASLVIVFYSGATTAILLTLLAIILSILTRMGFSVRYNMGRLLPIIIIAVLFVLFSESLGRAFISVGTEMASEEGVGYDVGVRMQELGDYMLNGDKGEDLGGRTERYDVSLKSFYSNPLWGGGEAGGHSAIFDILARYGVLGFISWFLFFLSMVSYVRKYIDSRYTTFFYEGILMCVLMLISKNMASLDMWFCVFVLLPLMIMQLQELSAKKRNFTII